MILQACHKLSQRFPVRFLWVRASWSTGAVRSQSRPLLFRQDGAAQEFSSLLFLFLNENGNGSYFPEQVSEE